MNEELERQGNGERKGQISKEYRPGNREKEDG